MIYLVTVNYYSTDAIAQLIQSIQTYGNIDYKFIIVNNSPDDAPIHQLKTDKIIIIEAGENLGFGRGCNRGLNWIYAKDTQAIIWIINPDAYFTDNSLQPAKQFFSNYPEISILGTIVCEPTGQIWFSGGEFIPKNGEIIATKLLLSEPEKPYMHTQWVTGCSLLINLKQFPDCPQFDPDYFLYYEDCDFCLRYGKQGHIIAITEQIKVIHQPSSITNRNINLKIQHTIYSYLLTLQKHASHLVLLYRLARITVSALISLPFQRKIAMSEIKGVLKYCERAIKI
ncbi:MAG TPA: glycosyl transferase [Cyanobacteria bacterium UBA11372]|nr:glycosyl transferase [Cyanobacteria bacterium UBA11372]